MGPTGLSLRRPRSFCTVALLSSAHVVLQLLFVAAFGIVTSCPLLLQRRLSAEPVLIID